MGVGISPPSVQGWAVAPLCSLNLSSEPIQQGTCILDPLASDQSRGVPASPLVCWVVTLGTSVSKQSHRGKTGHSKPPEDFCAGHLASSRVLLSEMRLGVTLPEPKGRLGRLLAACILGPAVGSAPRAIFRLCSKACRPYQGQSSACPGPWQRLC